MSVSTRSISATLLVGTKSYPLAVTAGSCDMSESISPFVGASITVAHPGLSILALIDTQARVRINASTRGVNLSTTLNVQARQLIAETGEVGMNLVNDEAVLEDFTPTAATNLNPSQGSVLAVVTAALTKALGKPTTVSFASGTDVAVPTTTAVENLIPGGNFEASSGLWTANNATLSLVTGWKQFGSYAMKVTPNAAATTTWAQVVVPVSQGQTYTMSAYVRVQTPQGGTPAPNARRLQAIATFQDGGTTSTAVIAQSVSAPNTANTTTRLTFTFTVPWNAVSVSVRLLNGATNYNDNGLYIDGALLTEGDGLDTDGQPLDYFDGSLPATDLYQYAWTGDAGLSTSTRTPLIERDPSALTWSPGVGGMSFLQPVLQSVGLRLFQDIDGTWYLADNDYAASGQARMAYGYNLYRATDLISRTATQTDGLPLYADAVVLRYEWTDALGRARSASDIAAPAGYTKPYVPDVITAPFPGKGRAAYMLSRLRARQRQLQVAGAVDYSARPGQEAVITTPDGGVQTGYVDAVTWDFGAHEMQVTTKGLIATKPSSWYTLAPGVAWSASPVGSSWAAETV